MQWHDWSEAAFDEARRRRCPVLLYVEASWCRFCRELERDVLADPRVDIFAPVPFANAKSVVRCAFLALDHNTYHLGEFAILRQGAQLWPKDRKG